VVGGPRDLPAVTLLRRAGRALLDEQPSALFEAMASMPGLDDLVDGQRALQEAG
jgi:hypothetical protein